MATLQFKNNFSNFRGDFIKDTGIKNVDDNMGAYINYVSARLEDQNFQMLVHLLNEMINLPRSIAFESGRK